MSIPQELEQDRHDLRLKLQGCQAQWESQVGELERDIQSLNAHAKRLTQQLSEAEKERSRSEEQNNEISQQIQEQLQAVSTTSLLIVWKVSALSSQFGPDHYLFVNVDSHFVVESKMMNLDHLLFSVPYE